MKLITQSHESLVAAFKDLAEQYNASCHETAFTDIFLQPNPETGEMLIFNDEDEQLGCITVEEWKNYSQSDFYAVAGKELKSELLAMQEKGVFDNLCLLRPYSIVLVDENKETVTDLLLVNDEETLLLDEELLKGLDKELDDFLKDLLEK